MPSADFMESLNTFLEEADNRWTFQSQGQFNYFMDIARNCAWDIPSALGSICDDPTEDLLPGNHDGYFDIFPMHREPQPYWPKDFNPWPTIDLHFKTVHNLDLTDPDINWNFDT